MKNEVVFKNVDLSKAQESFEEFVDVDELTLKAYRVGILNFMAYLKKHNINNPTRIDFKAYRDELKSSMTINTINTYMTAVRALFKYLELNGLYENITRDVKSVRTSVLPKTQIISAEKLKSIYNGITDLREKAIFSLACSTGLRANEIATAKIENIKTYNGEVVLFVKCKKRDDESEYNKLSPQVIDDLYNYIGNRSSGYIFISTSNNNQGQGVTNKTIRSIIKKIFKDNGIDEDRVSCHSLRRSFATIAYQNGADTRTIQDTLHQKSLVTTNRYINKCVRDNSKLEYNVSNILFN